MAVQDERERALERARHAVADPERLEAVAATGLLDAGAQASLERFTRLARSVVGAPVSLVSLVDVDRQYFPAFSGLTGLPAQERQTSLSRSLCKHVVADGVLRVDDTAHDPVVGGNEAVADGSVQAYLGVPLEDGDGHRVGAVCAIDERPHAWTDAQQSALEDLAEAVSADLQLRAALRRNEHQASHDALTGLGNRRALAAHLGRALSDGQPPSVLHIFDLDGFKQYNDRFGHPAGDALLELLGGRLAAEVEPEGGAFRLGGDEFCVISADHDDPDRLLEALTAAGPEFTVTSSVGSVRLPDEAQDASDALRRADERLYRSKRARLGGSAEHVATALLQALAEHDPELRDHAFRVATLAEAVAERLALDRPTTDAVRLTSLLHDVGKVAVPDGILAKPGPLDDDEWAFVRQHTIIGQRIVAATPLLAELGALVRASHERFDGDGYPDGLVGEDIPLPSRIVTACDALDAMVCLRPFRAARSQADALLELGRCRGTHFDPTVLDAILGLRAGPAPQAAPA